MYCAYITKIKNIRKAPNSDRLYLCEVYGENCIINDTFNEEDLYIYFPADGQLSEEFAVNNNLIRKSDGTGGFLDPNKRNVKIIKLRGNISNGIILPLSSLQYTGYDINLLKQNDEITELNGHEICRKYIPKKPNKNNMKALPVKKVKEIEYPFFKQHIDTPQLRFCLDNFSKGDEIIITEKVHGTSARTAFTLKNFYKKKWYHKLFKLKGKLNSEYEFVTGTRRTIIDENVMENLFYEDNKFRLYWSEQLKPFLTPDIEVFYEIVGYYLPNKPIMPSGDNHKLNDKNFIKRYGETTNFSYGCNPEQGESQCYIYRITYRNRDFSYEEIINFVNKIKSQGFKGDVVPVLDTFTYTTEQDFLQHINKFMDIPSTIDNSHIMEGVVIRANNKEGYYVAKQKCNSFLILEGVIKENSEEPDLEEVNDCEI